MAKSITVLDEIPSAMPISDVQLSDSRATLFDAETYARRKLRLAREMEGSSVAWYFVTRPADLHYLCGFTSTSASKVVGAVSASGEMRMWVAASEAGRALVAPGVDAVDIAGWDGPWDRSRWMREAFSTGDLVAVQSPDNGVTRDLFVAGWTQERIKEWSGAVGALRLRADAEEVALMRQAAAVTAAAWEAAIELARKRDVRDAELAAVIQQVLWSRSDSSASGHVVVGIDDLGGIPHSTWEGRPLSEGSVAFLEFAGAWGHYGTPVMRTMVRGGPSADVEDLHRRATTMLEIVCEDVRDGAIASNVAVRALEVLADRPDVLFHNNCGYPVGVVDGVGWMNGAEFYITKANHDRLEAGMMFHVPISLRIFGKHAVGESATIAVTEDGCEILTESVKSGLAIV